MRRDVHAHPYAYAYGRGVLVAAAVAIVACGARDGASAPAPASPVVVVPVTVGTVGTAGAAGGVGGATAEPRAEPSPERDPRDPRDLAGTWRVRWAEAGSGCATSMGDGVVRIAWRGGEAYEVWLSAGGRSRHGTFEVDPGATGVSSGLRGYYDGDGVGEISNLHRSAPGAPLEVAIPDDGPCRFFGVAGRDGAPAFTAHSECRGCALDAAGCERNEDIDLPNGATGVIVLPCTDFCCK